MLSSVDIWKDGQGGSDVADKGRVFVQENLDGSDYLSFDCWKKAVFLLLMKDFVFVCYCRLICRDLPESKTGVISFIGYKNMFISAIQRFFFLFMIINIVIVFSYSHEMGDDP